MEKSSEQAIAILSKNPSPTDLTSAPSTWLPARLLARIKTRSLKPFGNLVRLIADAQAPTGATPNAARILVGQDVTLHRDGLYLRAAQFRDFIAWGTLRKTSHAHLTEWEQDWRPEDVSRAAFNQRIKADAAQSYAGRRFAFLIFRESDDVLLGGISLSDIRMGNRRGANIGYWVGEAYTRNGIATTAILALKDFAFERLGLQRLEAACQPGNIGSRKLLANCSFKLEGIARDYLKINGSWCDHEIWACTRGAEPSIPA